MKRKMRRFGCRCILVLFIFIFCGCSTGKVAESKEEVKNEKETKSSLELKTDEIKPETIITENVESEAIFNEDTNTSETETGDVPQSKTEIADMLPDQYRVTEWTTINDSLAGHYGIRLIKETDSTVILGTSNRGAKDDVILSIDKTTHTITNEVIIGRNQSINNHFKKTENGILVKMPKKVLLLNDNLYEQKTVELPDVITELMYRPSSEKYGHFGYDVNNDLSIYVFAIYEGTYVYDGELKIIIEPVESGYEDELPAYLYAMYPIFVGKEDNIFAMRSGYEGFTGFYYYNRLEEKVESHMGGLDRDLTSYYNGSKLMNISPIYPDGYGATNLMDLDAGKILKTQREVVDNNGNIVDGEYYYDMDEQIANISVEENKNYLILRDKDLNILLKWELTPSSDYSRFSIIGRLDNGNFLVCEDGNEFKILELVSVSDL